MAKEYIEMFLYTDQDYKKSILAKQGDAKSRYLRVHLLKNDGEPHNLTGNTVRFNAVKKDGTYIFNNARVVSATEGIVEIELTDQTLAIGGHNVYADITIFGAGNTEILTTRTFCIEVQTRIRNDRAIESSDEYGAVVSLFQDVYDMRNVIISINSKFDSRIGIQSDDISIVGDSDGKFGIASLMGKANRIWNYLKTQSTAAIVDTVNQIKALIGTVADTGNTTVLGRLYNIGRSTDKYYDYTGPVVIDRSGTTFSSASGLYKLFSVVPDCSGNILIKIKANTASPLYIIRHPELSMLSAATLAKVTLSTTGTMPTPDYGDITYVPVARETLMELVVPVKKREALCILFSPGGANTTFSEMSVRYAVR